MFGYDRVNERYLLENVNHYEMPDWARAEHMENVDGFMGRFFKLFRSAL